MSLFERIRDFIERVRDGIEIVWDSIPTWVVVVVFSAIVGVAAMGAFVFRWYPVWVFYIGLGALVVGGAISAIRQAAG